MKNTKKVQYINFIALIIILFIFSGCAGIIELPRRFLGISPYSFKKEHIGRCRYSQIFNSDFKQKLLKKGGT